MTGCRSGGELPQELARDTKTEIVSEAPRRPAPAKPGRGGVVAAGCTASPVERGAVFRRKNGATVVMLPAGDCAGAGHGGSARLGGRSQVIEGIPVCTKAASVRAVGPRASLGR